MYAVNRETAVIHDNSEYLNNLTILITSTSYYCMKLITLITLLILIQKCVLDPGLKVSHTC